MDLNSHASMDIDSWITERPQSDFDMSYSSGGQPPSIGDVRQIDVSRSSGSNQMYSDGQPPSVDDVGRRDPSLSGSNEMNSDGQPPSVNDVGRPEPSQSEASCNQYEGPDSHEVQQVWSLSPLSFGRPPLALSQPPPTPFDDHTAKTLESPISAYMRYLQNSIIDSTQGHPQSLPPYQQNPQNQQQQQQQQQPRLLPVLGAPPYDGNFSRPAHHGQERPPTALSQLPPMTSGDHTRLSNTPESPISAYMRYLQNSIIDST
ncbi:hypothetical protein L1887_02721 [Cichorium endivia]|nr:hypothetical protein L1887_02721 [Cichorium endivia]